MSDMCTDNHMNSYSSFSDKKPENKKEYKSCKELSKTLEGKRYLYTNRCRTCQHRLTICPYL